MKTSHPQKRELNFEQDLRIDEMALDEEWLDQPTLFFLYSNALASARRKKDLAKQNLLIKRAQIRKEQQKTKGKKDRTTESALDELLAKTKEQTEYIDSCRLEGKLDAAVRAMYIRKEALENLVKLLGMQYFSGPREPRNLREEVLNRSRAQEKVRSALNKNKQ